MRLPLPALLPTCHDDHMMTGSTSERLREAIPACEADRAQALDMFRVSRETAQRLDRFVELLLATSRHTNLISRASIPTLWMRHVADSLQLLEIAPPAAGKPPVWLDLGSGGGFPGIVIACVFADTPGASVHLIESNTKKAAFLSEVVQETGIPATVHLGRIEILGPALGRTADVVTARAVAPLRELCALLAPILKKGAQALLPKGQDLDTELTEATKYWNIEPKLHSSRTGGQGWIVELGSIERRK